MVALPLALFLSAQIPQDPVPVPGRPRRAREPRIEVLEVGLAVDPRYDLLTEDGRWAVFVVRESEQGADLNGDGDLTDFVPHVHDLELGQTTNLGVAVVLTPEAFDDRVAFRVDEYAQGQTDLNGDGDAIDLIAHVYDMPAGTLHSSDLFGNVYLAERPWAAIAVDEVHHGDLDGDGLALDPVVHAWNVQTGEIRNLGVPTTTSAPIVSNGTSLLIHALEGLEGTDLNGDGDFLDPILRVYDAAADVLYNTALALAETPMARNGIEVILVSESSQGATDLNGDGDASDDVLHLFHKPTSTLRVIPLAVQAPVLPTGHGGYIDGIAHEITADHVVFTVSEWEQGLADQNGDVDFHDHIAYVHDFTEDETEMLGVVWNYEVGDGLFVYDIPENEEGNMDLNGDGDALDHVLHVYDAQTETVTNTALTSPPTGEQVWGYRAVDFNGSRIAIHVRETFGEEDINQDGDFCDFVLFVYDAATGSITNTGLSAQGTAARWSGDLIYVGVSPDEGCDFTPDELRLRAWNSQTGRTIWTPVSVVRIGQTHAGRVVVLSEEEVEGLDLTGDGDLDDAVLRVVEVYP